MKRLNDIAKKLSCTMPGKMKKKLLVIKSKITSKSKMKKKNLLFNEYFYQLK